MRLHRIIGGGSPLKSLMEAEVETYWLNTTGLLVCVTCLMLMTGRANGTDNATLLKQIQETIGKVRTMSGPSMARTNEAEHLSKLTRRIDPKGIDDKTLENLISLLDTSDDSVRRWVAGALGFLGPRARTAVPALLKVMHETDCLELKEMTSAGAARVALKRIGVTPPPPDCEHKSN